jgi:hypothetical protein
VVITAQRGLLCVMCNINLTLKLTANNKLKESKQLNIKHSIIIIIIIIIIN